jgi:hypothetical protein
MESPFDQSWPDCRPFYKNGVKLWIPHTSERQNDVLLVHDSRLKTSFLGCSIIGSGRIVYSRKMTAAAMQIAEKNMGGSGRSGWQCGANLHA